VQEILR